MPPLSERRRTEVLAGCERPKLDLRQEYSWKVRLDLKHLPSYHAEPIPMRRQPTLLRSVGAIVTHSLPIPLLPRLYLVAMAEMVCSLDLTILSSEPACVAKARAGVALGAVMGSFLR